MCWICRLTKGSISHQTPSKSRCERLTCQGEKNQPVHNQNRPEDGQVEDLKPTADEADGDSSGCRMPELELRQPSDKRSELIILLRGQSGPFTILEAFILRQTRIELWLEKSEEQIQQVDPQAVSDDVPALSDDDPKKEEDEQHTGGSPTVGDVGR